MSLFSALSSHFLDSMDQEKFSLEEKLEELRLLVEKMQKGVSDFDQQVALFKQGSQLIKDCRAYLNGAELEIQQLIKGELQAFEPSDE